MSLSRHRGLGSREVLQSLPGVDRAGGWAWAHISCQMAASASLSPRRAAGWPALCSGTCLVCDPKSATSSPFEYLNPQRQLALSPSSLLLPSLQHNTTQQLLLTQLSGLGPSDHLTAPQPPLCICRHSMIGLLLLRSALHPAWDVSSLHMALQAGSALHPAWDLSSLPMALQAASVWLRGGEILIGPSSPPLFIALVSLSRDAKKRIDDLLSLPDVRRSTFSLVSLA